MVSLITFAITSVSSRYPIETDICFVSALVARFIVLFVNKPIIEQRQVNKSPILEILPFSVRSVF